MAIAGQSLAATLYEQPVTILLKGDLGAGKTTFTQGFVKGLGYHGHVVSPTYALEQRYRTPRGELLHLDLYRLNANDAAGLLRESDDHPGIRCVEWPERTESPHTHDRIIEVDVTEREDGRRVVITFKDAPTPSEKDISAWRKKMMIQPHIAAHCDAVADFCDALAERMQQDGRVVRPLLLRRSAEIHDLLRFLDFRPGAAPAHVTVDPASQKVWDEIRKRYPNLKHEPACAAFLRENGYAAMADIVAVHGLVIPTPPRPTIEQQLLFYADKRVMETTVVSLQERFDDFLKRYAGGKSTKENSAWYEEVKTLETELFGKEVP